jgi:hypothetical protein
VAPSGTSRYLCGVDLQGIFWSPHYIRHNQRRQEHLASLNLPLASRSVLEVGAGIGDHTSFFLDRGSSVIVSEGRDENVAVLRSRYPKLDVRKLDLDYPPDDPIPVEIVYCYGTLYHLERPAEAIRWMGRCATTLLLLETCVAAGEDERLYTFDDNVDKPDDAVRGHGCRPTRSWVRRELIGAGFAHVYLPITQPWHEEFPLDWTLSKLADRSFVRGVFVASREPIANPLLIEALPVVQTRV